MSLSTEITRIETAKADIAAAIEEKGVSVPDDTKLDGMAALIASITAGSSGDSEGKKAYIGTFTPSTSTTQNIDVVTVTGIPFKPSQIWCAKRASITKSSSTYNIFSLWYSTNYETPVVWYSSLTSSSSNAISYNGIEKVAKVTYTDDGFVITKTGNSQYKFENNIWDYIAIS